VVEQGPERIKFNSSISEPVVIVDSREQKPYTFDLPTVVQGLKCGDYSVQGYEGQISIERKSTDDLIGSISTGRPRFERELQRGQDLEYFALVVEASLQDLAMGRYTSRMNPRSVVQTLVAFSVRYRLPIWFSGSRGYAARITESLLLKYMREVERKTRHVEATGKPLFRSGGFRDHGDEDSNA